MIKRLVYLCYQADYLFRFVYRRVTGHRLVRKRIGRKKVLSANETNTLIIKLVQSRKPFMVGRIGTIELSSVEHVLQKRLGIKKTIPNTTVKMLCSNAGFFPPDLEYVEHFADVMLDAIKIVDLVGSWQDNELYLFKHATNPNVSFCQLRDIEPILGDVHSWLTALKGKKVLVIHPYEQSIQRQYAKRMEIFPNGFLPDFELKTLKAVQTIAGTKDERFATWFEALEWMKMQISKTDFDIALIGCGAYGFPLAAYVKEIGKQAIHIGGATQLIFGIIGSRWEDKEYVKRCVNEHWTRPLPEETPDKAKSIENACYW